MTHGLRLFLSLFLAGASLTACAQSDPSRPADANAEPAPAQASAAKDTGYPPGTAQARVREAIRALAADAKVDSIEPAAIPGFQQAIVGGQVLYISDDGKYLMQGTLFDIQNRRNLGEAAMAKVRKGLLEKVPVADRIVFAPPNPKHTVAVFTDVECGYCRRMHQDIAAYNQQGIAVEYVAFPRMGPASEDFRKMEAVWCAKDRRKALTDAKNDRKVSSERCTSPVAMQYDIGQKAGLTGTPMILTRDGTQLGGYLPPAELRAALDRHAEETAKDAAAKAAGAGS